MSQIQGISTRKKVLEEIDRERIIILFCLLFIIYYIFIQLAILKNTQHAENNRFQDNKCRNLCFWSMYLFLLVNNKMI